MEAMKTRADLLYEEVKEYQDALEVIMSAEDASPSDMAAAVGFQQETLKEEMEKCYKTRANYMHYADVLTAEAKIMNEKMKKLKARAEVFKQKAETLDEILKVAMCNLGEDRLFLPSVSIEVKQGIKSVIIDDPEAVPSELRLEPKVPEPSKKLVGAYLEGHPECEFAHFETGMDIKYVED